MLLPLINDELTDNGSFERYREATGYRMFTLYNEAEIFLASFCCYMRKRANQQNIGNSENVGHIVLQNRVITNAYS